MYQFMQIWGNCAAVHFLGPDRIKGPVDNVIATKVELIEHLLNNTYFTYLENNIPIILNRKPNFKNDSTFEYKYNIVRIVHEDPRTEKYKKGLINRINNFNNFLLNINKDNYYFIYTLNQADLNIKTHKLNNTTLIDNINYLKSKNLLSKTIFIGNTPGTGSKAWNYWSNDFIPLIKKYNLLYLEISDIYTGVVPEKDKKTAQIFYSKVVKTIEYGTAKVIHYVSRPRDEWPFNNILYAKTNGSYKYSKWIHVVSWLKNINEAIDYFKLDLSKIKVENINFSDIPKEYIKDTFKKAADGRANCYLYF